ncbi:MAG: hypothetical protein ACKO91_06645 [Acidimicrobiales bacterium]
MTCDRGSVSAAVVLLTGTMLAGAALVLDGGRILATRREAAGLAMAAARVGAHEADMRAGPSPQVDPGRADRAARALLSGTGARVAVAVAGDRVTVTVALTTDRVLPGPGGPTEVRAVRTARLIPSEEPTP